MIERMFTSVPKSLIFNALQLLAQLPSGAFLEPRAYLGIDPLHPHLTTDCRGFLHFYTLFTIMYRVLAYTLLALFPFYNFIILL